MKLNSNTTLVKVKSVSGSIVAPSANIQIQHLLKLNAVSASRVSNVLWIQIQHLLKLN